MTHSVNTAKLLLRDPQCPSAAITTRGCVMCPDFPGYELGQGVGHLHQPPGLSRVVLVGSPTRSPVLGGLMGIVSLRWSGKKGGMSTADHRIAPVLLPSGPAPAPPPGDAPGRCAGTGRSYK